MIYQSSNIEVDLIEKNIASLCFNSEKSINKLDLLTLNALDDALTYIQNQQGIDGLIIYSSKDSFIVGADITEFLSLFSQPKSQLQAWLTQANNIFNKLEDLPFPTVSVISGFALGGGCETILATDFRLADNTAQIGLPETKLGLIPGFGGTVRLPRLIGADNALEWITSAKSYRAQEALQVGVIDGIVATEKLQHAALKMVKEAISGSLNWQQRRKIKQSPLFLSHLEATLSFSVAKGMVYKVAGKHYPAPLAAVEVIEQAINFDRTQALNVEQEFFIKLAKSDIAKALIGIFLNDQYVKSLAKKAIKSSKKINHASVLGAGIMGGGIAYQNAKKDIPVVIKDIAKPALDLGLNEAATLLSAQIKKGRLTPEKMATVLNHITPSLDYSSLNNTDIVIEAVVEHPKIKGEVLSEVENHVPENCILASNTSTISINLLAKNITDPSRFCGMHFFNPVHKMPLVEVIKGKNTSQTTVDSVVAYASRIGKTPIIVNDCPGFFVNRVLFPYFAGFNQLLADGANFIEVDSVMEKEFGWPMGPAYLLDVVGLDTAYHAQAVMAKGFPERMAIPNHNAIDIMFSNKRLGQKNKQGFYQYKLNKKGRLQKEIDPQAQQLLQQSFGKNRDVTKNEIIARTMIPMIIETVRCLDEGIIASPAEADIGLLYGLGFPPFRGGVFRYIDTIGISNFIALADKYAHLGTLYQATESMRQLAKNNANYYSA